MSGNLNAFVPQPTSPIWDATGNLSREWQYFFTTILNRTGGAAGISSATVQQQAAVAVSIQTMDDVEFPPPGPMFSMSDAMGEDVPKQSWASPVLLSSALADDVQRAPINPFLASLLVSDIA